MGVIKFGRVTRRSCKNHEKLLRTQTCIDRVQYCKNRSKSFAYDPKITRISFRLAFRREKNDLKYFKYIEYNIIIIY